MCLKLNGFEMKDGSSSLMGGAFFFGAAGAKCCGNDLGSTVVSSRDRPFGKVCAQTVGSPTKVPVLGSHSTCKVLLTPVAFPTIGAVSSGSSCVRSAMVRLVESNFYLTNCVTGKRRTECQGLEPPSFRRQGPFLRRQILSHCSLINNGTRKNENMSVEFRTDALPTKPRNKNVFSRRAKVAPQFPDWSPPTWLVAWLPVVFLFFFVLVERHPHLHNNHHQQ